MTLLFSKDSERKKPFMFLLNLSFSVLPSSTCKDHESQFFMYFMILTNNINTVNMDFTLPNWDIYLPCKAAPSVCVWHFSQRNYDLYCIVFTYIFWLFWFGYFSLMFEILFEVFMKFLWEVRAFEANLTF